MSGLVALFHRDGRPVSRTAIGAMLDAAPYRGPDGRSLRVDGAIGLGHAKLIATPEEVEAQQPLASPRSGCVVIADVRLDNREALLAELPGRPDPALNDASLILRAYEAWGEDAATHLLGDFAFAIWDPRHQRLVCSRDTSGQRDLFYRLATDTFAVASEIQQLLQDPAVPIRPSEARIRDFLTPRNMLRNEAQAAQTFFEGILALPAGHTLVVGRDGHRLSRYWELHPPAEIRYRADDEYAEHLRALFFEVVRARLRCVGPIGVLLSGGLDSSSVACTARELYRQGRAIDRGFISFSHVFGPLDCDERPFIEDIAAKYGFVAQYLDAGDFAGRLQLEPRGFQEGPNMGIAEGRDRIFRAAQSAGVRVLLTGHIADAYVKGSGLVFDSLLRQGHLNAFQYHLRAHLRTSGASLRRTLALYCVAPFLPLSLQKRIMAFAFHRDFQRNQHRLLPGWMPEPLRQDLSLRHYELGLAAERNRRFSNQTREWEYQLLYPPAAARYPAPWSLELWSPFADRRLHEFMLAIPPEQKFAPHPESDTYYAGAKRVMRHAMRGIVPESIRTRTTKTVFSAVFENEIARQWPVFEAAFGPSARPEIAARGYVDRDRFWTRLQEARVSMAGPDMIYVMQVVGLETWLRSLQAPRPQCVKVAPPWSPPSPSPYVLHEEAAAVGV